MSAVRYFQNFKHEKCFYYHTSILGNVASVVVLHLEGAEHHP